MKQVSIREFQLKANEYLKDLPIILTRYGVAIAQIIPCSVSIPYVANPTNTTELVSPPSTDPTTSILGRCGKCFVKDRIERVKWETPDGTESEMNLCQSCKSKLERELNRLGGTLKSSS
jgi:antitoxin (DNA-binding transcriptional repressor) of toxin-antitoxin stability system